MELFIDALIEDKEMPVNGEDGLAATVIAIAAKKSMQEKRPVKLSEIKVNTLE
jgi:myo-inositol 2-dehydrogenase/D-chiro-inositol 1-dehydrogenase